MTFKEDYIKRGKNWPTELSPFFKTGIKESEVIARVPEGFVALNGPTAYLRVLFTDSRRFDAKPTYPRSSELTANSGRTKALENWAKESSEKIKNLGFKPMYVGYNVGYGQTMPQMHLHVGFNPFLSKPEQKAFELLASHPASAFVLRQFMASELSDLSLMLRSIINHQNESLSEVKRRRLSKVEGLIKLKSKKIARRFREFIESDSAISVFERGKTRYDEMLYDAGFSGKWDGTALSNLQAAIDAKLTTNRDLVKTNQIEVGRKFIGNRKITYAKNANTPYSLNELLSKAKEALKR